MYVETTVNPKLWYTPFGCFLQRSSLHLFDIYPASPRIRLTSLVDFNFATLSLQLGESAKACLPYYPWISAFLWELSYHPWSSKSFFLSSCPSWIFRSYCSSLQDIVICYLRPVAKLLAVTSGTLNTSLCPIVELKDTALQPSLL